MMGSCSGGITSTAYFATLGSCGEQKIKNLVLAVCLLDPNAADESAFGCLMTPETMHAAKEASRLRGVLDGHDLARMFAWMRPNDLIWNYWVNNYLLGNQPPAFDILYWNADTTRLPARLHGDYLDLYFTNPFVNPGKLTLNGKTVDMSKVEGRQLRYRRRHRPHHAVEGRLQDRSDHGREHDLRAFEQRTSAEPAQSADQSEGVLHDRADQSGRDRTRSWLRPRSGREAGGLIGATGCMRARAKRLRRPHRSAAIAIPILAPAPGTYVFD